MLHTTEQRDFPSLFEAVGCICYCQGRLLLLKRFRDKSYPGFWGLPGGKLNPGESQIRGMVRELYEETTLLRSADNLEKKATYHVVSSDASFLYTIFMCTFSEYPEVRLRPEEHVAFDWLTPVDALRLDLVPDLAECLIEAFPSALIRQQQLDLFTGRPSLVPVPTHSRERNVSSGVNLDRLARQAPERTLYYSFGPPTAGKTEAFKTMVRRNKELKLVENTSNLHRSESLSFYLQKAFAEEDRSFFFLFQIESMYERFWQTLNAQPHSLIDETIYTTLAYSRALLQLGWMKDYEYDTFFKYYLMCSHLLPIPHTIFYFHCNENTVVRRLVDRSKRRGHHHEVHYPTEYVDALCRAFADIAADLSTTQKLQVVSIDSDAMSTSEIADRYAPRI
jgi:8-oxo-dGTP pyrophosphatase MutT (NUDIX family)/deoxyadenosine/deoxycytidine kinase